MKNAYYYQTIVGRLGIAEENGFISAITFTSKNFSNDYIEKETDLIKQTISQINEYFAAKRKDFNIKMKPLGTPFQQKVWLELAKIPYGQTRSYQDIAVAIGSPKAVRAVGGANNKNPIPIIIPCHRVIGKNGSLVGYGGGLDIKKRLLELESQK